MHPQTLHPVLFTIPLPSTRLSLLPGLLVLVLVGVAMVLIGLWRRAQHSSTMGLGVFGAALASVAGYASLTFREHSVELTDVAVPAWGALLSLWLLSSWWLSQRLAQRQGLPCQVLANSFVVSAVSGLVVSRLLFVGTCWDQPGLLDLLALRQGGLSGVGALLGALAGAALVVRRTALSFWQWLDLAAPVLGLGLLLLRLGCYLYGCDFGSALPARAPSWLTVLGSFPRWTDPDQGLVYGSLAWVEQVKQGSLAPEALTAQPLHPVQLYESSLGAALVALALVLWPRRVFHGQVGLSVLLAYASTRFVTEVLHDAPARGSLGPWLEPRIYLPIFLALVAVAYLYGPLLTARPAGRRWPRVLLSLTPALAALWLARPLTTPAKLSVTQWLCLLVVGGVAYAWSRRAPPNSTLPQHQPEQSRRAETGGHDTNRQLTLRPDDARQGIARH